MPLYTLWETGSVWEIFFAGIHCTGGDLLIAGCALTLAVILAGGRTWPDHNFFRVAVLATVLGLAFTLFSEWLNIEIRNSWGYRDAMPRLPLLGTGFTPVLQWLILPPLSFWWAVKSRGTAGSAVTQRKSQKIHAEE